MTDTADENHSAAPGHETAQTPAPLPEFLWEIVEQTRDHALILLDAEGRIVSWHRGAEAILGYEASEIIGAHFSCLYPLQAIEGGWPELELKLAAAEGRFTGEGWRLRKDGSRFWASVELTALRDSAGELRGFGKFARDVAPRRPLDTAERAANELVTWLSNELRNPLAPLCSAVDLMRRKRPSDRELERWLEILERQCAQLVRLADDLLDMSKAVEGTLRIQRQELDLAQLLPRLLEACHLIMDAQGHNLIIELPQEPLPLWGDPLHLSHVLKSLLVSAARDTPTGTLIWLTVTSEASEVEIRVSDSGPEGTSEELPEKSDWSRPRSGERRIGGLEIALTFAREVIEQHGGRFALGSAGSGLGREFVIRLPLSPRQSVEPTLTRDGGLADTLAPPCVGKPPPVLDRHFVRATHFSALNRLLTTTVTPSASDGGLGRCRSRAS